MKYGDDNDDYNVDCHNDDYVLIVMLLVRKSSPTGSKVFAYTGSICHPTWMQMKTLFPCFLLVPTPTNDSVKLPG